MSLINSNVFKEKLNYLNYELYNSHPVGELSKEEKDIVSWYIYHISKMVDNMSTESAIPIEWIKKYIEDHTYEMVNPNYVDDTYNYVKFTEEPLDYCLTVMPIQVKAMLADWERENG